MKKRRILSFVLALTMILSVVNGDMFKLPASAVFESVGNTATDTIFNTLLTAMSGSIPADMGEVSYSNNYQSMQPEPFSFGFGNATKNNEQPTVNNGLHLALNANTVGLWNASPYLKSGYMEMMVKHSNTADGGIGFAFKSTETGGQMTIRNDGGNGEAGLWVVQDSTSGSTPYVTKNGTSLSPNVEHKIQLAFHGNKLVFAIDGTIIFNEDIRTNAGINVINNGTYQDIQGQFGIFKRGGSRTTFDVTDVKMKGIGTAKKPVKKTFYDYEGATPVKGTWGAGVVTTVVDDGTGKNNVMSIKRTSGSDRVTNTDSVSIADGSLSMNMKLVNTTNLPGYAFGFRYADDPSTAFSELGIDVNANWLPEYKKPGAGAAWGSDLGIEKILPGKWYNIHITFEGKNVKVWINNELQKTITSDAWFVGAGKLGFRLRGNVELMLDNVLYTSEVIEPRPIPKYENNFDDGITGDWSNATETIVKEGSNGILKLTMEATKDTALLTNAISVDKGSFLAKIKSDNVNIGVALSSSEATQNIVKWNSTKSKWVLAAGATEYDFAIPATSNVAAVTPKVLDWNYIGMNFPSATDLKLNVNGVEMTMVRPTGLTLTAGMFGIYSTSNNVFVDNLLYTEKETIDLTPNMSSQGKMYYEEYYETVGTDNWTGFTKTSTTDGYLVGTIAANTAGINNAVTAVDNGIYQIKMNSSSANVGIKVGNTAVYHTADGAWMYKIGAGTATAIGTANAACTVTANKDYIVKASIVSGKLTLNVNNVEIGTATLTGYDKTGGFGIYNPTAGVITAKIDAMAAEEIRVYQEDYATATTASLDWAKHSTAAGATGTGNVAGSNVVVEAGALKATLKAVVTMVDNKSIALSNQNLTMDFTPNIGDGAAGGRYGVILMASDIGSGKYISVEVDINGSWRVLNAASGDAYSFPTRLSLDANKKYAMDISIIGKTVSLTITDTVTSTKTNLGTVTVADMVQVPGKIGLKSWFGDKAITLDNIKNVELQSLPNFTLPIETKDITVGDFTAAVDMNFPRVMSYTLGGTKMTSNSNASEIYINNIAYTPTVVSSFTATTATYNMTLSNGVTMTATLEAKATNGDGYTEKGNVVEFKITAIDDTADKVKTVSFGNMPLAYADTSMTDASYAWAKSDGQWHGLSEERVDNMSNMVGKTGNIGTTMTMISGNGLAASLENNVMSGGNKVILSKVNNPLIKKTSLVNGTWTYRHPSNIALNNDKKEALPWYKIVITKDMNADAKVDWQDGAVAYRRYAMTAVFDSKDMANNMMYIPFNFASQATDPFLNSLDTAKVLYNYSDGFGQMLLHKGYQDEGHDSDIPSYSNIGVRQGGVKDLKKLINEGDKYNTKIGVHLNATEYHLDANELNYKNISGATTAGPSNIPTGSKGGGDRLSPGWDWVDTTFYVDQTKDVISGELEKRFDDLYELTKTVANGKTSALDFYYIDVYTGNDYNAHKMLEFANSRGIKIGTEFAGPLEPGANFVHWGPDLGYPNKGNGSLLYRMVKNAQDIFVGNALFKGQKIPVVSTWGDSKPDVQQGVMVLFNEVIPTKFMQHYGVMKLETNKITFDGNVVSERYRDGTNNMIKLTKDGKIISKWADSGTTTDQDVRHTGEANSLIPWVWDNDSNVLGIDAGAKLYHWNTTGNATTWELTDTFKNVAAFKIYELTQLGRVEATDVTLAVTNGSMTITGAKKNTPYVVYPATVNPETYVPKAADWGEGSPIKDFAFNSESLNKTDDAWKLASNATTVEIVAGPVEYYTTKEMTNSNWNRYAAVKAAGDTISQVMDNTLIVKGGYNASVWTETPVGRKSTLKVTVTTGGIPKVYENFVTGMDGVHKSNFKYRGQRWQKLDVDFLVPETFNLTTDTIKLELIAAAGDNVVKYDDVKIWKHIVEEDWSKHADDAKYAAYEDFENVAQGFGIFEYGDGSLKDQLKSTYKTTGGKTTGDGNTQTTPAAQEKGPLFNWVLNGKTSLKFAETDVGRLFKTSENGMKLKPNTEYEMSFNYTLESNAKYEVIVKSRSATTDLVKQELLPKPTLGKAIKAPSEYNTVTIKFTTDNKNDYQVIFRESFVIDTNSSEPGTQSAKTELHAFILDNFAVKEVETVKITKAPDVLAFTDTATTLTATVTPATATMKWYKNGVEISGATTATYAIPAADIATASTTVYKLEATVGNETVSAETTVTFVKKGDATGDGSIVNLEDALTALKFTTNTITPTAPNKFAADVNKDGTVTKSDISSILNFIMYGMFD